MSLTDYPHPIEESQPGLSEPPTSSSSASSSSSLPSSPLPATVASSALQGQQTDTPKEEPKPEIKDEEEEEEEEEEDEEDKDDTKQKDPPVQPPSDSQPIPLSIKLGLITAVTVLLHCSVRVRRLNAIRTAAQYLKQEADKFPTMDYSDSSSSEDSDTSEDKPNSLWGQVRFIVDKLESTCDAYRKTHPTQSAKEDQKESADVTSTYNAKVFVSSSQWQENHLMVMVLY